MKENPTVNYSKINEEANSKMFNVRDEYKDNSYEQNVEICKSDRLPFSVGLINLTGDLNIGMILRSACLLGAESIYMFGRKKYDKRSTVGAEKYINIIQYIYDDPIHADEQISKDIYTLMNHNSVYLCETNGAPLKNGMWKFRSDSIYKNSPLLFLFGSESHGIPESVLNLPRMAKISIPQRGVLRSFNVSAAMNIICWDYIKEVWL